jgi:YHS domain-containing protein
VEVLATQSPICPGCSCSLVRLGINKAAAARHHHRGVEYLFCCQGCVNVFQTDPEAYLEEMRDLVVCAGCLAEKPRTSAVRIQWEDLDVYFCRCPGCLTAFHRNPQALLARLAA